MEIAPSSPLSLGFQMNPRHLALHPPSLYLKPIELRSSLSITTNNGRGRRRRRRRPTIGFGPFKLAAASFKRAASFAMSLRDLLSQTTADPLNLLLLHYGGSGVGGGGGGGSGLPTGGSGGGDWFGKRRRGGFKFKGIFGLLLFSISLASVIFEVGEKKKKEAAADWELGVRVLVPAALGFKIRVWRNWVGLGLTVALGVVSCYILLRPSGEKNCRPG